MQTPIKAPQLALKRRNTQIKSITPRPQTRSRLKTTYHDHSVSQITTPNAKQVSDSYAQYAELVVQSVKKNYMVGNIKPFAVDKSIFKQLKMQISGLKEVQMTPRRDYFSIKNESISGKFNRLLTSAISQKQDAQKTRGQLNNKKLHAKFVKSTIEDDLQNLIQDYKQESKQQKIHRQKTIQSINKHLRTRYSSFLEGDNSKDQAPKNPKNRLIKFKKQRKVVRVYSSNDEAYKPLNCRVKDRSYNDLLDLKKQDYGIYSRSANKALYYDEKKHARNQEEDLQKSENVIKMQKKFYRNYLGSYSQRKNILRLSQASIVVEKP